MRGAIVAGHLCVDLVPALSSVPHTTPGQLVEIGPLRMRPGGCVANTGGVLVGLGVPVTAVADIGDDELGATLLRMLAAEGIDTARIRTVGHSSTSYTIALQPPGRDRVFWHHVGA